MRTGDGPIGSSTVNEGLFGKLEKNGRLWESRSETVEGY